MLTLRSRIAATLAVVTVAATGAATVAQAATSTHPAIHKITRSTGHHVIKPSVKKVVAKKAVVKKAVVKKATVKKVAVKKAAPGVALSTFEARLVVLTNQARVADGLVPLVPVPGATDVARHWSQHLASVGQLSHNPNLVTDMQNAGSDAWTTLEENVGVGPANNADALFAAYMASPHHRENILGAAVRFVGMGTALATDSNGAVTAWNTMTFTDAYSSAYGPARTSAS